MHHINKKYFTLDSQLWKDQIWKMWHDVRHLEKFLKYLNTEKSLRSKDFTEHCICIKEYFDMFFCTLKHIPQAQNA